MREIFTSPVFIWLALMILFLVVEIITVGLTSIWFAGGALAALLASFIGAGIVIQILIFFAGSFILLFYTRPFALKYVKPHNVKTNYEEIIGKNVLVTERINNTENKGKAVYNGLEWTARSTEDHAIIEAGETVLVEEIKGVKLYVKCK